MFRKIVKSIRKLFKNFKKLSIWFRLSIIFLVVLITFVTANRYYPRKEGFNQKRKFIMKKGINVYDDFYADIYNDLLYDANKNNYEIGEIIKTSKLTKKSLILDIGSGTGQHVAEFNDKGFDAVGLDLSPSMVNQSKRKYPHFKFKLGNALESMLYPPNSFTHITCFYFTIYYIKNKQQFLNNCYEWLKPGGRLIIHLVNRKQFNPILNNADPINFVSVQKYSKKRITNSLIKFNDFQYKGDFKIDEPNDKATFEEIFKNDETKQIRQNIHELYFPKQQTILNMAKEVGFIVQGKIDMIPVQYEYQYLYILKKPE